MCTRVGALSAPTISNVEQFCLSISSATLEDLSSPERKQHPDWSTASQSDHHRRTIQPLVSAHQTLVPQGCLQDTPEVQDDPWSEQEDALLAELSGGPEPRE
jgi:hypothetical protein